MTPIRALIPACMLLAAPTTDAGTPVRVQRADLTIDTATLIEMDETRVLIEIDGTPARTVPVGSLIAIVTDENTARFLPEISEARPERVFLELTDGQRVIIDLEDIEADDALGGLVLGLGPARVPLERVARLARPGATWIAAPPDSDIIALNNDDVLTGFIAEVGTTVVIELQNGPTTEIPLGRIREVRFANPSERTEGLLVTDNLGVTLFARTLSIDDDSRIALTTDPGSIGVDSDGEDTLAHERPDARLAGIRIIETGTRVVALAGLAPDSVAPTGGRRWTPDPEMIEANDPIIHAGDIRLPAPARVVLGLPAGADRFACGLHARAGTWTDCVARILAVRGDGVERLLGEHRLTGETTRASVEVELPRDTRQIVLEVDPGNYGAVQDDVVFIAPRVRVRD